MRLIINYMKISLFQFIMIVINILLFIFYVLGTRFYPWNYRIKITILAFIPVIAYTVLSVLKYRKNLEKKVKRKINIISILLLFTFLFFQIYIFGLCLKCEFDGFEISQKRYSKYVKDTHLLKIFPNIIPSTAKNVSFYRDAFSVILYYIDETLDIEKLDRKYSDAEWIGYKTYNYDRQSLLTGNLYDKKIDMESDYDFRIYLIEGKCDDSGYCNHGVYWLMAFNEKTKEVIYKFSNW